MAEGGAPGDRPTLSMTGYAELEVEIGGEPHLLMVRSVNHRGLDVDVKLPAQFGGAAHQISVLAREMLVRGRVTIQVEKAAASGGLEFDEEFLGKVRDARRKLEEKGLQLRQPSLGEMLQLRERAAGASAEPGRQDALVKAAKALLGRLLESRATEGARLRAALDAQLRQAGEACARIAAEAGTIGRSMIDRTLSRFGLEPGEEVDPKIKAEVALACAKADVTEEIDRLRSHLDEIGNTLAAGGPVGRKVDFLLQECRRETGTLTSKAAEAQLTRAAMELSLLVEQMREQIQNVE